MTPPTAEGSAEGLWTLREGAGPLLAVAIHDGHDLRPEVAKLMALSEEARLREEDPFTGAWTKMAGSRLVACRSRFEVDLNRPRERAVYIRPEDAWGLRVWQDEPAADLVERSLEEYDAFYRQLRQVIDRIVARRGHAVVFDLHSYNHRRAGPGARFDSQAKHPDVNIGTGTMHRARWAPVIDRVIAELKSCDYLGRQLDVRENVKFLGGALSRWVHETYPNTVCSIAIEFKKFFMDEWSGQLYVDIHRSVLDLLKSLGSAVVEELASLAPAEGEAEGPVRVDEPQAETDYGQFMAGLWSCPECHLEVLPRELMQLGAERPFRCADCGTELTYHDGTASS